MQLKAEQLPGHIKREGLLPVYLISGDEPLQSNEATDLIRHTARAQGVEERVVLEVGADFDWNRLIEESGNMSLFASTRLIELRLGTNKPGRDGGKVLTEYTTRHASENILMITCGKVDKSVKKTKWYKSLDKAGITIQIWPVDAGRLTGWLSRRVQKYNKRITVDAAQLIADSVEGNMLAASQEVDKLCLLVSGKEITADDVVFSVIDSTRFDVFDLIKCAYADEIKRMVRILNGLRNEGAEPIAIYGALMWDFRRLCSMAHRFNKGTSLEEIFNEFKIWDSNRKSAIKTILNRHHVKKLHEILRQANFLDRRIKSAEKHTAWDTMLTLLLAIAGHNVQSSNI